MVSKRIINRSHSCRLLLTRFSTVSAGAHLWLAVMEVQGQFLEATSHLVARVLGKLPKLSSLHPTVKPGAGSVSAQVVFYYNERCVSEVHHTRMWGVKSVLC
jgi:hypothetical protein